MVVPKLQVEETYPDTPETSASEPMSPSQERIGSPPTPTSLSIERPKSACDEQIKEHHDAWYPRRLSFSIAQDAIETWYMILIHFDLGNTHLTLKQTVWRCL
jgi:hypothetical protein